MKVLSFLELCKAYPIYWDDGEQLTTIDGIGLPGLHGDVELEKVIEFYSQPFKPELITELFEGWEREGETFTKWYNSGLQSYRIIINDNYCHYMHGSIIGVKNKGDSFAPRTLDDFINDCQRAGIELIWRTK